RRRRSCGAALQAPPDPARRQYTGSFPDPSADTPQSIVDFQCQLSLSVALAACKPNERRCEGKLERRTRIWIGLGTALLVSGTGVERVALARETPAVDPAIKQAGALPDRPRMHVAQAEAAGE